VLRAYPEPIGRTAAFSVYDQIDADAIAREVAQEHGITAGPVTALRNPRVREAFDERLRASNALVYDQLIPLARRLLTEQRGNHRLVQHGYQEVLVDESQDLDDAQHGFLADLAPGSLWLVGDPRQAIYQWRGARPDLLTGRPGTRFPLTLNYRSTKAVVDVVNRVGVGWPPPVEGHRPEPGCANEYAADYEFTVLPDLVRAIETRGYGLDDICILGRTWRNIGRAAQVLREDQIRTRYYGDDKDPWNIEPGRTLLRWLALNLNPCDDNLAGLVARGIYGPDFELKPYRARAVLERRTLRHELTTSKVLPALLPRSELTIEHGRVLRDEILRVRPEAWDKRGDWCVDGLESPLRRTLGNFRFWVAHCRTAADRMAQSASSGSPPGVHMMTVHAAKGLEWPVVVIIGACRKVYDQSDEDRHVLYVACSRARDELHLVRSTREPYHETLGVVR
jgi:ATP-dependent DNA helicase Rep